MDNHHDLEVAELRAGGTEVLAKYFQTHESRLRKMVAFRLDRRVAVRVAAEDILQECFLEASRRLDEYLADPNVPLFIWLRFLAGQQVATTHRRHRQANRRSVGKEVQTSKTGHPLGSSAILQFVLASLTTPSLVLVQQELESDVRKRVQELDATDREILNLRHYEELSNAEAAMELSVSPAAASKRYLRALEKLRESFGFSRT